MKIFLDSADVNEIETISNLGIIDGITTNPSLMSATSNDFYDTVSKICTLIAGDVSVEVVAADFEAMIIQAEKILKIADNIVIKLPITWDGIRACKYLSDRNIKVNMTLCFSANQALLAAKAGAYYISPFIGRLEDIASDGLKLLEDIRQLYDKQQGCFPTQILAASVRNPQHVYKSALIGVDAITMSGKILQQLLLHPLTTTGLNIFNDDWAKSRLNI